MLLLGIDGLEPTAVDLLVSEGRMPAFARLKEEGACGILESQQPLLSPVIWTTIATGRMPSDHGVGDFLESDPVSGRLRPVTRHARKTKALWNIVSEADETSAVVGWWATWPPEEIRGAIVSDYTTYHFLLTARHLPEESNTTIYPPELEREVADLVREPSEISSDELAQALSLVLSSSGASDGAEESVEQLRWALATAQTYGAIGRHLWKTRRPTLEMVYIESVDSVSHLYGHLFRREALSGPLAAQQARFGKVVEEMYRVVDRLVERYMDDLDGTRDTLFVLSDHGFRLGWPAANPAGTSDLRRVNASWHKPEGMICAFGPRVERGRRIENASILDIAPTVLGVLGLPAGEDMPGRVLEGLFEDLVPLPRIASHESIARDGTTRRAESDERLENARFRQLEALGYLAPGTSRRANKTFAESLFQQGHYSEAADLYRELVAEDPFDADARASLGGVLGQLGRYSEGLGQIEEALTLDATVVKAYHNRGVIFERQGDPVAAAAEYRNALSFDPGYEPALRALARLEPAGQVPGVQRTAEEDEALGLAAKAQFEAQRGSYEVALSLLEEARVLSPENARIHHYRANVLFLMGDFASARDALTQALLIEPANPLFLENMKRLERGLEE